MASAKIENPLTLAEDAHLAQIWLRHFGSLSEATVHRPADRWLLWATSVLRMGGRCAGLKMLCLQFGLQVPDFSLPLSWGIQPNYLKFALPIAANSQKKTPTIARS